VALWKVSERKIAQLQRTSCSQLQRVSPTVCCSVFYDVLQCNVVSDSAVQRVTELQCVALCCIVLQCVALCCTVLQCVAVY